MAIEYKWIISAMDTAVKSDELTDVVKVIHWRRSAQDIINGNSYYVDTFGAIQCDEPDPMSFTPYQDLTFEQICGWLESKLDVSKIDENLSLKLENVINPPIVQLPLPWESQQVVEQSVVEEPSEQQSGL